MELYNNICQLRTLYFFFTLNQIITLKHTAVRLIKNKGKRSPPNEQKENTMKEYLFFITNYTKGASAVIMNDKH